MLLVVPTRRRIRHLSRELLTLAGAGVAPALPIHTLASLALSVYRSSPAPRRLIAGPAQTLLFDGAVRQSRESLGYFRVKAREQRLYQGTFDRVIDVILHLKESGVTPDLLEEEAAGAPADEQAKLRDVALLYRAYDERLAASRAVDDAGVMAFLHAGCTQEEFRTMFRTVYPALRQLSLAGFDEFTAPELGFIRKLCGLQDLSVSLLFDFQHRNRPLFGHLEDNYARFLEMGFREERLPRADRPSVLSAVAPQRHRSSEDAVEFLSRHLFTATPATGRVDLRNRVTVVRAPGRLQEVEWICTIIRMLVAERPERDLSSICVAMVRPGIYTDLMREQFRRFGIPANVTDRYELSRSPVVVAVLGLLQMVAQRFRRDDVLRVLASPYLPFADGPQRLDTANLAAVARRLRIVGGERTWHGRIQRAIERVAAREPEDAAGREDQSRELDSLRRAEADLHRLVGAVEEVSRDGTPSEFHTRLRRLLGSLEIGLRVVDRAAVHGEDHIERDVRAYARLLGVVDDMVGLLEEEEGADARRPLRHYVEHLRVAVSRERYNVRERFGRGVLITSIDETRGLALDVMIVAGLVDGEFPSMYQPEIFLSAQRQKVREKRHEWQNRYLLYQGIANWREKLYLTHPEHDGELELVRSSFVDALLNIAEVTTLDAASGSITRPLVAADEVLAWHLRQGEDQDGAVPEPLRPALAEVRRASAIEQSRIETHRFPEYEGNILASAGARSRALLERMRDRTFSVTQLETYAECPFRFFAERVLRLDTPEEFREDLSPLERGTILHEALFEFYAARRQRGLPGLSRCTDAQFRQAVEELADLVAARMDELEIPDAFWHVERELLTGRPGGPRGLVQGLLDLERSRRVETEPRYFEVAFGSAGVRGRKDTALSREAPFMAGDVKIRGKIDRVDTGEDFFVIIDYKTGRSLPGPEEMRSGRSLQIPIYLLAVEQMLQSQTGRAQHPAGGLYYQIRDPVKIRAGVVSEEYRERAYKKGEAIRRQVPSAASLRDIAASALRAAESTVEGIVSGRFPLTDPKNIQEVCTFCPFKAACRIQSIRHVKTREKEGV